MYYIHIIIFMYAQKYENKINFHVAHQYLCLVLFIFHCLLLFSYRKGKCKQTITHDFCLLTKYKISSKYVFKVIISPYILRLSNVFVVNINLIELYVFPCGITGCLIKCWMFQLWTQLDVDQK